MAYRLKAIILGVEFIGIHKSGTVLFQDPVTGSSFATKRGEPVKAGIRRVRGRFGLCPGVSRAGFSPFRPGRRGRIDLAGADRRRRSE